MQRRLVPRITPVVLIALFALFACGANARTQALRAGLATLNVARDTERAASKEREAQIVTDCNLPSCTKEEGHARLDAWRATVDKAAAAISDGYDAIWAAALLDDAKSVSDATAAVAKAVKLVKDMKNPTAPPKSTSDVKPANKEAKP